MASNAGVDWVDQEVVVDGNLVTSRSGDSGALVYDEDHLAVGILIGGNCFNRSYVTPIERLLSRFGAGLA